MGELQLELNRLAGTTGLDAQGAANVYAGTTGLDLVGALNAKAGNSQRRELAGVLNQLAGTTGLGVQAAAAAIAGTFTPYAGIYPTPKAAVWARDLVLADGAAVASWSNPYGNDLAQATEANRPTYRASVAAFGGAPAVEFVRASTQFLNVDITDIPQPYKIVGVVKYAAADAVTERWLGTGANNSRGMGKSTGIVHAGNFGAATVTGAAVNTNAHIVEATINGTSSSITVDGAAGATGSAGVESIFFFTLGVAINGSLVTGNPFGGHIHFAGIYDAAVDLSGLRAGFGADLGISVA